MAGALIDIKVDDREVRALFKRLRKKVSDLTPVMKVIGEIVRTSVVENFEAGGRPKRWQPLSPRTLKRKRNKGRILIEEGHLMDSIKSKAHRDRVEVGTNKVYAAIHQFGGRAGRNLASDIPARPYLAVQDSDMQEIRATILDFIMDAKKGG